MGEPEVPRGGGVMASTGCKSALRESFRALRVAAFLSSVLPVVAQAATIERRVDPEMGCVIHVSGPLLAGDTDQLISILHSNPVDERDAEFSSRPWSHQISNLGMRICFDSPGGSFAEALTMARYIQTEGLGTAIPSGARCESACAIAFMAGVSFYFVDQGRGANRAMHSTARLGFHAPALGINFTSDATFDATSIASAYGVALQTTHELLNIYGLSELHRFPYSWFLLSPSEEMRFVETIGEALMLDIEVIGLTFPNAAHVFTLQRACQTFTSVAYFWSHGSPQNNDEAGAFFTWRSFSEINEIQEFLFPDPQPLYPWALVGADEFSHYREREINYQRQLQSDLTLMERDSRVSVSIPMFDGSYGYRGAPESTCKLEIDRSGFFGSVTYTSGGFHGDYAGIFNVGYLYDPSTPLSEFTGSTDYGLSHSDFTAFLVGEIRMMMQQGAHSGFDQSCWLTSPNARIINVSAYVNLRRQPDFSARVIRQVPLGEQVRPVRFDNITIIGQERDRQSCINACQSFGANREDRAARERAQQCINDNMLWYEITDARGNRGWVSRRFLEEVP
jgi:hypothetical protein